ncbi:hypothetical protein ACHHYP_01533 [Achlya hypogyna]|uniref:Secreted protein n=1 Tax=Achlya hypogyna TaxID=1202772 RepID=A0A1V9Z8E1_ACHHY|nr:hypothetical protein ACHHYP_01533 [Achlya hypogyna]
MRWSWWMIVMTAVVTRADSDAADSVVFANTLSDIEVFQQQHPDIAAAHDEMQRMMLAEFEAAEKAMRDAEARFKPATSVKAPKKQLETSKDMCTSDSDGDECARERSVDKNDPDVAHNQANLDAHHQEQAYRRRHEHREQARQQLQQQRGPQLLDERNFQQPQQAPPHHHFQQQHHEHHHDHHSRQHHRRHWEPAHRHFDDDEDFDFDGYEPSPRRSRDHPRRRPVYDEYDYEMERRERRPRYPSADEIEEHIKQQVRAQLMDAKEVYAHVQWDRDDSAPKPSVCLMYPLQGICDLNILAGLLWTALVALVAVAVTRSKPHRPAVAKKAKTT